MHYLNLTLPTAEENLARDEALLEEAETPAARARRCACGTRRPLVVVGRSSRLHEEVRHDPSRQLAVPVLRRISGGAAIVAGPGCPMYSLVLSC